LSDAAATGVAEEEPHDRGTAAPRRRARVVGERQRARRLSVRVSAGEHAEVAAAALVGLTPAGFTAAAVLAAARGASAPQASPVRAARVLNAGGAAPEWLDAAVEASDRAVARVDAAAAAVARRVR